MDKNRSVLLTPKKRLEIIRNVRKRVLKNYFNSAAADYGEWQTTLDHCKNDLLTGDDTCFEKGIQHLLEDLGGSHTSFYHDSTIRLAPQHVVSATLGKVFNREQPRWFFLDLFEEGPAERAGIKRGDILREVDGVEYMPPVLPPFRSGAEYSFRVSAPDGSDNRVISIGVPVRKGSKHLPPILPPRALSSKMIAPTTGFLRITWFPGAMGLAFSKALDGEIESLKQKGCNRLVIDLRGNLGGGMGFARLASYLCPDRMPLGYSLTPKRLAQGYNREALDEVVYPDSRVGFGIALSRYSIRDKSIMLLTQGLGRQPFHGKVAILVNEWTNSAAEIVTAFASEMGLATIIGTKTAGNVLGASIFSAGSGYWLSLPVFGWFTSSGKPLERHGVCPHLVVQAQPEELRSGIDKQLGEAVQLLSMECANKPDKA